MISFKKNNNQSVPIGKFFEIPINSSQNEKSSKKIWSFLYLKKIILFLVIPHQKPK